MPWDGVMHAMSEPIQATILVVDDSEDNRFAVSRHLQKAGFTVIEAENGEETMRKIEDRPDLVILDVDLPDMNGFEVCQRIKSDPGTASIPVLHLSATFTKTRHRIQGLEMGADGYLCHPVEPLELIATINALLRLKQIEQALQEANRRKDEFLAMLAHELRNPLAPIRSAVEVLRMRSEADPLSRSARDIIDRQATHLARLVDDLLDVTRIARGKVALKKERCDLVNIVRHTAEDYRAAFVASRLVLNARLPDEPIFVSGDPTRLSQIVGNLLHNALKFTEPGGNVTVAVEANGPWSVHVSVQDTGIGMDATTLRHIFEPFSQADHSLERSRGGLGLGLALVKGLTELHGGDVQAASHGPGRGSRLTFRLPLDGQAADGATPPPPNDQLDTPRRVLVVEDNMDAADSMRMLLELLGHEVEVAVAGPAGVEAVRRVRPEIVLCDIGLPGMDGYAVARTIRQSADLNGVYLVAVTGYGQQEDQDKACEAGFDAHLTKPAKLTDLRAILTDGPGRPRKPRSGERTGGQ